MASKAPAIIAALSAVAVLGAAVFVTASNLIEAYGSGPPYYGLTTNMDKWESPVPFLVVFDGVALLIAAALGWFSRSRLKGPASR